ncbi:putative tellurium resistance membrane protein TerC [Evansella vedderi]|uniref:Tellurium resistance membrane protein TerC n=1 Tax=Evansella vedderi TaxID=38282 RepID=A0ABT9ZY82_9BACI|nr:hypothetical protein [Evansella vedderi]MDQ0255687.1 putative tellurium resistance membrane protein TerC [Evansella vedderi]
MAELLKVFLISFVSDLDNIIVYVSILKRYASSFLVVLVITAILTINRTFSVSLIHYLYTIPWVEFSIGVILLIIAFKMASKQTEFVSSKRISSLPKVLFTIIALDLVLSIDNVLIVSELSRTPAIIYGGIGLSLFLLFMFSSYVFQFVKFFPWAFVVVAAFIGYTAMENMIKNNPVYNLLLGNFKNMEELIPLFSKGMAIIILIYGLYHSFKNDRIYIIK